MFLTDLIGYIEGLIVLSCNNFSPFRYHDSAMHSVYPISASVAKVVISYYLHNQKMEIATAGIHIV
jgi:hypothetical protein